jgi:hypothetical protein
MNDQQSCGAAGKEETCEACGAEFRCEPSGACWCFSETIPKKALEDIQERYRRCLCPVCLKQAVSASLTS